ncbi:MAG TPA: oxidoreductase [Idiomarina baltica]|uniref:Oxidoreductase n=1 Tax=Idiomarina baltica TaxID=190892 RepID=A0A348WQK4_9GAMM|nr:oxidoreductase [Idiomarinaceae bacterium]MEC8925195.1 PQQ-dependent sugar dehydrogenase [Pseudomonadota bacterium]HAR56816.1 oxidoreductase [Idiomarina baltica]
MKSNLTAVAAALLSATMSTSVLAQEVETERHTLSLETISEGLNHPWGIAFLPSGDMLVTERSGTLNIITQEGQKTPIQGTPEVVAKSQGGLLDVNIDPDYADNGWVYISYSEKDPKGGNGNSTAVMRGKIDGDKWTQGEVIFRQAPKYESNAHFGSRLVFSPEGHLFITLGERYSRMQDAQTLDNHHGKIVRIWPDGSIPKDNPFVGNDGALDEIWSYGHRNVQGAAIHPDTGELWTIEHGPQGGDEVNIPKAGKNYGWPTITYGEDYGGGEIGIGTHKEGMEQPFYYWLPSIATAGSIFYTGDKFPKWKGDLLVTALRGQTIARLDLEEGRVLHEERMLEDATSFRIRDIEQGPEGFLYILTDADSGQLIKLSPVK